MHLQLAATLELRNPRFGAARVLVEPLREPKLDLRLRRLDSVTAVADIAADLNA